MNQHIGILKGCAARVIMQFAPTVDQLSCELWHYLGEFKSDISLAKITRTRKQETLRAINRAYGTSFTRLSIEEVHSQDFTAGHTSTLAAEIEEARP